MSDNIDTYGVVAGNTLNLNFGASKITGDVGSFNTITGSGTQAVSGSVYIGSEINDVLSNVEIVYSQFIGLTPDTTTTSAIIGGLTFNPGVHALTNVGTVTIGGLTPQITLDGPDIYLFLIPNASLVTDPTSAPVYFNLLNGALSTNVYWLVSGDLLLQTVGGNTTAFAGTVLCQGNITIETNSSNACGLIAFSSSPNGNVTLNENVIVCRNSQFILDQITNDYINIETTLADSAAIQINAVNPNGGILINSNYGGTAINSTNSVSINAGAGSNLSTTLGDVLIQSQPALVSLDGGSGINIGTDQNLANTSTQIVTPVINIGTSSSAKAISIGNTTSSTSVTVNSGSGDIVLNSSSGAVNIIGNDSSSSAINFDASSGSNGINMLAGSNGITANSGSGKIQFVSNSSAVDSIRFDSSGSSGGLFFASGGDISLGDDGIQKNIVVGNSIGSSSLYIQSGSSGITSHANSGKNLIYSSNSNVDAIRIDSSLSGSGGVYISAGSQGINIGNDATAHPINIGNTTGTTSVAIVSGSYGLTIGNDSSGGEIQIANGAGAKVVTVGNNLSGSRLFTRYQTAWIKHQENSVSLSDSDASISAGNLLPGLLVGASTLTANRVLTLDTAANIISAIGYSAKNGDAIDFTVINPSSATDFNYSLAMDVTGTMVGDNIIYPTVNSVSGGSGGTYRTSNSTLFRVVVDVTNTLYTVYRLT